MENIRLSFSWTCIMSRKKNGCAGNVYTKIIVWVVPRKEQLWR